MHDRSSSWLHLSVQAQQLPGSVTGPGMVGCQTLNPKAYAFCMTNEPIVPLQAQGSCSW